MADKKVFPSVSKIGDISVSDGGLSKREYFALQILVSKPNQNTYYIKMSVEQADLLIHELEETSDV